MKINLGCGSTPLKDYTNVDMDTLEDLRVRYPNREFSDDIVIQQWDIFNLPVEAGSVDEVRADCLFEHLSFIQEKQIFFEVKRVLKTGGKLNMCVPDFETIVKLWLQAEDNWKDWYRTDQEAIDQQHWFGNNEYSFKNRWGFLTAIIYGSQNGKGQYHKNCYTINKLRNICNSLNMKIVHEELFDWPHGCKGNKTIRIIAKNE